MRNEKGQFVKGSIPFYKGKKNPQITKSKLGMKYIKHKENPTSFKKGNKPWCTGTEGLVIAWNKGTKGVCKAWNKGMKRYTTIEKGETFTCNRCEEEFKKTAPAQKYCVDCKKISREAYDKSQLVKRKDFCEICASQDRLEKHHWRYDKPLLVNTLCFDCHNIQHIKRFYKSRYAEVII